MTTLPVSPVVRPAVLAGQSNGELAAGILVDTTGQAGGPTVRLVAPAARAWRALCAAALVAGHPFRATSFYDSYRPYTVQRSTFLDRYQTQPIAGAPTRVWNSVTYYQRPDTVAAAVPGTSNHGWGLAVDIAEESGSISDAAVTWLVAHAATFGWSAELQSEPWHWRYYPGDAIPAAVLDYEGNDDVDEATRRAWDARMLALMSGADAHWTHTDGRHMTDINTTGRELAELRAAVTTLRSVVDSLVTAIAQIAPATLTDHRHQLGASGSVSVSGVTGPPIAPPSPVA